MFVTTKNGILIFITFVLIVFIFSRGPVPQDPLYHDFADQRTILGLTNGYNVLSNALFILFGAWGAVFTRSLLSDSKDRILLIQYFLIFTGVFLTGFGSAYYHYAPSNQTLLWDRLPMSISFTALLASVISESINRKGGAFLLAPFLALGMFSVLYWDWTEKTGQGDLRPYIIVQFLPVVLIPLILLLYKPAKKYSVPVWSLAALYTLAKVFEVFDRQLFVCLGFLSGHTIKHIAAALGTGAMLKMLYARRGEFNS